MSDAAVCLVHSMAASAGLAAHREDQAVLQGQLLLVLGPGAARHMYRGTPPPAAAFLVRLLLKKPLAVGLVGLRERRCHSDFREGGGYDPHPRTM